MLSWELMQVHERAQLVVNMFPTLAQEVVQQTIGKWATGAYEDSWYGEQKAIDDLMMMLREASMSAGQKEFEKQRVSNLVKDKLK